MKKYSLPLMFIGLGSLLLSAQNQFYYNDNKKIPLRLLSESSNTQKLRDYKPVFQNESGMKLTPTGYIHLKLKHKNDVENLYAVAKKYELEIVDNDIFMPLWYTLKVANFSGIEPIEIANEIYETSEFASCFPDFAFDALEISYDPYITKQWSFYNYTTLGADIDIANAWTYASGRGVKIAIIDDGIDVNHEDLVENIYMTYNCEIPEYPIRVGLHGTHCAGIAAATRNNGKGISGVAPDAKIMAAGMSLDYPDRRVPEYFGKAINWAWENGADIISCSWSCNENPRLKDAILNAAQKGRNGKGCIIVAAAGNAVEVNGIYKFNMTYPATFGKEIIAVGATDIMGNVSSYSCYGDDMFICAPGDSIWSTVPYNKIDTLSGTSMACPHVAGIAALILERNPNLTATEVRSILARSTKSHSGFFIDGHEFGKWNPYAGYGLINAYEAIKNTPLP